MKKKRRRRCVVCKKLQYDVQTVVNPYDEDINGIKIKEPICPACYDACVGDI